MKFHAILFLFFAIFFYQCEQESNQNSNAMKSTDAKKEMLKNDSEIFNFTGREDEIEYEFKGIFRKKGIHDGINYLTDSLIILYKLKNKGAKGHIIFNQGHSNNANRNIIYVEPKNDGVIELSQRIFGEPSDKMCPTSYLPIIPRGSILKANSEISEKSSVELPLKRNTPFDSCTPLDEMPKITNKVKFCIGIVEKDAKTQLSKEGFANPSVNIDKQKLLCSDYFEIK